MNRQIIEEAAEWFVEVSEDPVDAATRRRFHAWLMRSPEHAGAFLRILPMWQDGAQLDAGVGGDPEVLIARAREATSVVSFGSAPASSPVARMARRRWGLPRPLAAAFAVFALGGLFAAWAYLDKNTYVTDIGEQRTVVLDDGSSVELNSRSRIRVRFGARQRSIDLLEGQALFSVAKDAARPFVVRSGETSVRAVGTQFDVYRKKTGTIVTVVEGEVAVSSPLPLAGEGRVRVPSGAIPLTAGEQLTLPPASPPVSRRANLAAATAWTQKQLVFFSTPLPEVAEEFNRHNTRQLILEDDSLDAINITGAFSSTDPASLIRFLRAQPGLRVDERRDAVRVGAM